ncbi:MAG TPA: hypothetical protein PKC69_04625 [Chitinophagaceae bacterium]|nr:hypothetical protein [Chitinophagaceae bacterium]
MRYFFICIALFLFASCDRKPYVSHKVKLDMLERDCNQQSSSFRITANIAGERYEFEKCLPADFEKAGITSFRQGDTVVVRMANGNAAGQDLFRVTLDIDSYPAYRFLTIDNDTYEIGLSRP